MDTKFMNSKNGKTSEREVINMLLYITLAFTIHGKI